MAKKDTLLQFSTNFVLQNLDGGVASFNVVTPERGADTPPVVGAYCTLTIADEKLFSSLTVGDRFDVTFTKPGIFDEPVAEAPKKAAKAAPTQEGAE